MHVRAELRAHERQRGHGRIHRPRWRSIPNDDGCDMTAPLASRYRSSPTHPRRAESPPCQRLAARAATERDGPTPSELRTRRRSPACLGRSPTTGAPGPRRSPPTRTEGTGPCRTRRGSPGRGRAPSRRRPGARPCCGTARRRGSACGCARTGTRHGSCTGAATATALTVEDARYAAPTVDVAVLSSATVASSVVEPC